MKQFIGFLLIIVSAVSFGVSAIFARFAYAAGTDPITLLFLRFGIAAFCMFSLMSIKGFSLPRGRVFLVLVLMGAIGYAGQAFCYFTALTYASAGLVALLLYLYPALVTLLAAGILKESISTLKITALFLALIGTFLTIGPTGGGQVLGILLAFGAAFIYSFYIIVGSRITSQGNAVSSSTVIITAAAVVYSVLIWIKGTAFPTTFNGWISVIALALISTVLGIITFLAGLERVGPTNAATLSTIEPVVTVVLAASILGEMITPLRIIGGMMILLAVIILAKGKMAH
jgi:drug/metabolite transporter (DMT)-like permease